ncbi:cadherin repeat domain-containing protein [Planctomicrobium piriforme]|uniref:cadherin repeat domain-containing protein n=1 Tax=Planctomicrobium piriforme TaxID=1576369 RepID=UPI000B81259F|nr:cadherin repeat domain-containing protein [Planctomicrobium piriforme]
MRQLLSATPIGGQTNAVTFPDAGRDANGNYVVTTNRVENGNQEVYAQRYNSSDQPIGGEFHVNQTTTNDQRFSEVAINSDGSFVIVWTSTQDYNFSQDYDVYARQYNASGTPISNEIRVNTQTEGRQQQPGVAIDADGDFVVVWKSDYYTFSPFAISGYSIFAQRYNASGVAQGSNLLVNPTQLDTWAHEPSVAMDDTGNFLIAWEKSTTQSGSHDGIGARLYSANGTPDGSDFQVETYTTGWQTVPVVVADVGGGFSVYWTGEGPNATSIYRQQYGLGAAPTDFGVSNATIAENDPIGTVIGDFGGVVDGDSGQAYSYSLVAGDGDVDNASFTINGSGQLLSAEKFNFETQDTYLIRVKVSDSGGFSFEKQFTITVTDVNDAPSLENGALIPPVYIAKDVPLTIFDSVIVTEEDGEFANSTLTLQLLNGAGNDKLELLDGFLVTVNTVDSTVSFNGTVVGTYSGGTGKTALTISFNSEATDAAVNLVLAAVRFSNSSSSPTAYTRSVSVQLTDGSSSHLVSPAMLASIQVSNVPVVRSVPATTNYQLGSTLFVAPSGTLADGGGNFANSILTVRITNAGATDLLTVAGRGLVTFNSGDGSITYKGTTVATLTGGQGTTPLSIAFNGNGTMESIQAVLRQVTFSNTSQTLSTDRKLAIQLADGSASHALSAVVTQTIQIDTTPVLRGIPTSYNSRAGASPVGLLSGITVADGGNQFAGSSASIQLINGLTGDLLTLTSKDNVAIDTGDSSIRFQGVLVGSFTGGTGSDPLLITFNGSANLAAVQAVLRRLTFSTTGAVGDRTLRVTFSDGSSNTSAAANQTVHVLA